MALNIAFDGFLCLNGVPHEGMYFQARFLKVNGQSSASKWNDARQAGIDGYYSFNLGDGDFLGQDGVASAGDLVLIAAWEGQPTRDSLLFGPDDPFGWIVVTIGAPEIYTRSFTAVRVLNPFISLVGRPTTVQRLTDFSFTNQSRVTQLTSAPIASGKPGPVQSIQSAWYPEDGSTLLVFPCLQADSTWIDWNNDLQDVEVFSQFTPHSITHQYADPPGSVVTAAVVFLSISGITNETPQTFQFNVTARIPTPALTWTPQAPDHPLIGELVTFEHTGIVDPDAALLSIDYLVEGVYSFVDLLLPDTFQFTFALRGNRPVRQTIHWDNGFAPATVVTTFQVPVLNEAPVALWAYDHLPSNSDTYTFFDASTDRENAIANRVWTIERDDGGGVWSPIASGSGAGLTSFVYSFTVSGHYRTTLVVTDDQGAQDNYTQEYDVAIAGGGGGGTSRARSALSLPSGRRVLS